MTVRPKICFFGLGDHARRAHLKHLAKMDIHPEIGVFDPSYPDEASVRAMLGAAPEAKRITLPKDIIFKVFTDEGQATAWADAVMICSPDNYHLPQMWNAIQDGCHVFCEKPLVDNDGDLATLRATFARAEAQGVTVTSCHPRRFDPPYVNLKAMLPELVMDMGPVVEVKLDFSYHKPSKTGLHGGSMLQDHANHELDYLNFLMGYRAFQAYRIHDEEDRYHMAGMRVDGVAFSFGGTRRLNKSVYPETIWVRFERGEVFVDTYDSHNSYMFDHELRGRLPIPDFGVTDYDLRFSRMNAHWLELMAGRARNYLTEQEMILNTEISVSRELIFRG